mgnify:CR=1 FL=1|jgi:hypothetical protein
MGRTRIVFKANAFRELRSAPGIVADLVARGNRVKSAAESGGGKYKVVSQQGEASPEGRWRVSVETSDPKAMRINARDHSLLRALDAGR